MGDSLYGIWSFLRVLTEWFTLGMAFDDAIRHVLERGPYRGVRLSANEID